MYTEKKFITPLYEKSGAMCADNPRKCINNASEISGISFQKRLYDLQLMHHQSPNWEKNHQDISFSLFSHLVPIARKDPRKYTRENVRSNVKNCEQLLELYTDSYRQEQLCVSFLTET